MLEYENGFFAALENLDVANQILRENKFRVDVRNVSGKIKNMKISRNKKKILLKKLKYESASLGKSIAYLMMEEASVRSSNENENVKKLKINIINNSKKQFEQSKYEKDLQIAILSSDVNTLELDISNEELSLNEIKDNFDDFKPGELVWNHLNQSEVGQMMGQKIGLSGTYAGNKIQSALITELISRKENINTNLTKRLETLQGSSNHSKKVAGYLGEYLKNIFF